MTYKTKVKIINGKPSVVKIISGKFYSDGYASGTNYNNPYNNELSERDKLDLHSSIKRGCLNANQ